MSQITYPTCRHHGKIPLKFEFDGIVYEKSVCVDCFDYVKSSTNFKIISEVH